MLPPPDATGPAQLPASVAKQAACVGVGAPDLFFDDGEAERAKQVCAGCPVLRECLEHALQHERFGIWGGTTPDERDAIRGGPLNVTPEDRREADRIRELLMRGISQEAVAEQLGVNLRTIGRWWTDSRQPRHRRAA